MAYTPPEKDSLEDTARMLHDARCGCDRRYRTSCPLYAQAILDARGAGRT